MELNLNVKVEVYEPPTIEVFEARELIEKLGPVVSCSGYGGATSGCN